jgi:hypothetical protein
VVERRERTGGTGVPGFLRSMTETYRTLPHVMGPVDVREDIPEWAEQYAVGEEIMFRHPENGLVMSAPVAGFSSKEEYRGLPAIVPPSGLRNVLDSSTRTVVVRERNHVPP